MAIPGINVFSVEQKERRRKKKIKNGIKLHFAQPNPNPNLHLHHLLRYPLLLTVVHVMYQMMHHHLNQPKTTKQIIYI